MTRSRRPGPVALVALVVSTVVTAAMAQTPPAWVVSPGSDVFSRGGSGSAYVEAFAHPGTMRQIETGLFVACEPRNPDGYDVFAWIGVHAMPGKDAFAGTVEVLTRRADEGIRSSAWTLDESDTVVRAPAEERGALLADLRRGGTVAIRVVTDPSLGAAQPTFQFLTDGFAAVEAELACAAAAGPVPARDPFAPPAPAGPGVGPVGRTGAATTAAPQAPTDAPGGAGDGWTVHPITGLYTYGSSIADLGALPPSVDVRHVVDHSADFVMLLADTASERELRGITYGCSDTGGGNGVLATVVSPHLPVDGYAYLVLFESGAEVGEVELAPAFDDGVREAVVEWDEDEVGLYLAMLLYGTLDAVLVDEAGAVLDGWRIVPAGFATAIDGMPCALR